MATFDIPDESIDAWIQELKTYQRSTLNTFLSNRSPEEAAELWLTTIGSRNIAGFGGSVVPDGKPFWEKFKAECRRFICDDNAYVADKDAFRHEVPVSKDLIISVMSSAIGSHLGTAGTLIAPAVTLILFTVGRLGRSAYCAT